MSGEGRSVRCGTPRARLGAAGPREARAGEKEGIQGEGVGGVQDYFRKRLIRMGVVKPTDAEAEALMAEMQAAGQQQDPNAIFLQAAAEEAVAKAARARADTVETIASAELKRAQTAETIAKASEIDQNIALTTIEALEQAAIGEQVQPVVR